MSQKDQESPHSKITPSHCSEDLPFLPFTGGPWGFSSLPAASGETDGGSWNGAALKLYTVRHRNITAHSTWAQTQMHICHTSVHARTHTHIYHKIWCAQQALLHRTAVSYWLIILLSVWLSENIVLQYAVVQLYWQLNIQPSYHPKTPLINPV